MGEREVSPGRGLVRRAVGEVAATVANCRRSGGRGGLGRGRGSRVEDGRLAGAARHGQQSPEGVMGEGGQFVRAHRERGAVRRGLRRGRPSPEPAPGTAIAGGVGAREVGEGVLGRRLARRASGWEEGVRERGERTGLVLGFGVDRKSVV